MTNRRPLYCVSVGKWTAKLNNDGLFVYRRPHELKKGPWLDVLAWGTYRKQVPTSTLNIYFATAESLALDLYSDINL